MDNFQTIEVRWFYPGVLPDDVSKWFGTLGQQLEPIDTRSDVYLQSRAPDIGVKLRQGNLEIKYRQQEYGIFEIDQINSRVEQWSKWVCIDQRVSLNSAQMAGKSGWITVDKIRDRRLYQVEFGNTVQLTQVTTPSANIAAIELTQLQLQSQTWWTIACEYFGSNLSIDRQFLPLVKSLRTGYPSPPLTNPLCCSYPQWLMNEL